MKTENDNKQASRASQTRSKTERPKVWSPPSLLDAPPAPYGYQHRWLRESSLGFDDTKNIHKRLRSGYELVRVLMIQSTKTSIYLRTPNMKLVNTRE